MNDECITWDGPVFNTGYGKDQGHLAHRLAWIREYGPIPEFSHSTMVVHHVCENKLCVNTKHLQLMTRGEHAAYHNNIESRHQRMRDATHCKEGHEYTAKNTVHMKDGSRRCRECARRIWREYYHRKKAALG